MNTMSINLYGMINKELYAHYMQVRHSQCFRETPLSCWIIIERDGQVCRAHCNCMAGLGETCTQLCYFTWRTLQEYKASKHVLSVNVSGFYHHFKRMLNIFQSKILTSHLLREKA